MTSSIAERVAARYWDPEERASAEKEPNIPKSVKDKYGEIKDEYPGEPGKAKATAWSIFCEKHEDSPHCHQDEYFEGRKSSIATRVATEYSLALSIGKALRDKIFSGSGALFPANYFAIKDTYAHGVKGFGSGYFSFGLEPREWIDPSNPKMKVLASGSTLLIWGGYDPTGAIKSTKPADPATPWGGNPEMADESLVVRVFAGYYNKLKEGGVKEEVPIGKILVQFDAQENATVDIADPESFKANLEKFVMDTQANPPPDAVVAPKSGPSPRPVPTFGPSHDLPEYESVQEFIDFVVEHGDTDPNRNVYDAGGRAVAPGWIYGMADVNLLAQNTGLSRRDIEAQLNQAGLAKDDSFKLKISSH